VTCTMARPPRGSDYTKIPVGHPGKPRPANVERVSGKRVDCEHYAACLALTARKNWPSFTCSFCPNYTESSAFPRAGASPTVVRQRNLIDRRALLRRRRRRITA
jgi:hypothetical protein